MFRDDNKMFQAFAFAGFASLVGIVIASTLPTAPATESRIVPPAPEPDPYIQQAAYNAAAPRRPAATSQQCSPWDVSPEVMEKILEQMIARGWTPPARAVAASDLQMRGSRLQVEDPALPVPVPSRPPTLEDGPMPNVPLDQSGQAPSPAQSPAALAPTATVQAAPG